MSFTLSNVFGGAFSSLRKGFVPLLVVTVVLYLLPTQLISVGLRPGLGATWGTLQQFQGNALLIYVAASLVMYFLAFMHISAVYEVCVLTAAGKPVKLGEVFVHSLGNAVPIFVIYLLCALGWFIGLALIIVPAFIFGTLFSVVIPAYVTEKPGIFGAFSRSRALTKGHRWGIFGLWVLMVVIFYILMMVIEVPIIVPMLQASFKAAHMGRPTPAPVLPSFPMMLALGVGFSLIWVVILSINASAYSCLRAGKERLSANRVEKVFE